MTKKKTAAAKPATAAKAKRPRSLRHHIHELEEKQERMMATAKELQASVDAVKTAVEKVVAQIAALKAQPQTVEQAQLDANTADLTAAAAALQSA